MANAVLRPFFSYYGGKWRATPYYPKPEFRKIIEPFAGSAGYSVRYPDRKVFLADINPIVVEVWRYLITVKESEIRKLPVTITDTDTLNICQEAKWLIGFWLNRGSVAPRARPSTWMKSGVRPNSDWGEAIRERIASQVQFIRHWKVARRSYQNISPDKKATWFVDPPYESAPGRVYTFDRIDYDHLATWCRQLSGQVIVCERTGANWLPFRELGSFKSLNTRTTSVDRYSKESIWTNG